MLNTGFFDEFDQLRRSFDRLFENTAWPTHRPGAESAAWRFAPTVESGWTDDHLNLRVVLPAVKQEDLDVTVQGNQLVIRGERRAPQGFGKEGYTYSRLPYGSFERTVDLPNGLNAEKLEASLHDGVLDIRIPVAAEMKPRKIQVISGKGQKTIAA